MRVSPPGLSFGVQSPQSSFTPLWGGTPWLPCDYAQKCGRPSVIEGEQIVNCGFVDPTSMQSFDIMLSRKRLFHQLRGWKNVPWSLASGSGKACAAEVGH